LVDSRAIGPILDRPQSLWRTALSAAWCERSPVELAPVRVNAIHPGAVGDSPAVKSMPSAMIEVVRARTPTGRLATMGDVAAATLSLLDNSGINGVNLPVDGGFLLK
jgi:NAD(P)-dependent dehydrogenase (short-subunit alcohol dehydrogenase family)